MPDWRLNMSMPPASDPTRAKVPQGDIATLVTFAPSPVSNFHRPALFLPHNQVRANLSPSCPVTTLSQPVVLLSAVLAPFPLLVVVQISLEPGIAPIPPSRFSPHAIHVILGAFKSSSIRLPSCDARLLLRIPIFLAFLRTLP